MKPVRKKVRAGTLQFSNLDSRHPNPRLDDVRLTNAHEVSVLIDPESMDDGDLHFSNLDTAPKPRRRRRLRANNDTSVSLPNGVDPDLDDADDSDTFLRNAQGDSKLGLTGDNDDDDSDDDFLGDDDDDLDSPDLDIDAADGDDDDAPDWDDDDIDPADNDDGGDDDNEELGLDAESEDDFEDTTEMPIAEIKQVDDTIQNVAFVMNAGVLLAIKDTTVVASMSKARATRNNVGDLYTTAAYHGLLKQEARKHGLIAALVSNGFRQERVNLKANRVISRQLKLETNRIQASLNRSNERSNAALEQSIAIAAVGISRNFFKKVENPLRAALERELISAGVRNPNRMLRRAFSNHGPEYVDQILTTAHKISAMSDEVRNDYADALDLNSDDPEVDDLPIESEHDDNDDEIEFDSTDMQITAALLRKPTKVREPSKSLTASARAQAKLRGEIPLFHL